MQRYLIQLNRRCSPFSTISTLRTLLRISAQSGSRRRRSASHFANWTYIAGYAPASLFRVGLSPAWTSIAKGLTSNDLRTGEKLAEKTGAFPKKHLFNAQNVPPGGGVTRMQEIGSSG
jgi:hypothetical protein